MHRYRVWDIKNRKMVYSIDWERFGFIDHTKDPKTNTVMSGDAILFSTDPSKFIWMNYTGFDDKNGNPIYERDFINTLYGPFTGEDGKETPVELPNFFYVLQEYYSNNTEDFLIVGNEFEGKSK